MDRANDPLRQYVALDIETDGGQREDDEGPNLQKDSIVAVAMYCDTWYNPFVFHVMRGAGVAHSKRVLQTLFTDPNVTIIGHNLQFDLGFIKEKWDIDYPPGDRLWDTMLAEKMLTAGFDEERVNLAATVQRHFGVVLDKSLQTSFTLDSEISPEQIEYIRGDVEWLPQLAKQQAEKLSEHGMNLAWEVERFALPVFTEMVRVGIEIDLTRLRPLLERAAETQASLKKVLQAQLTPALEWPRMQAYEEMQEKLDQWNAAREEAIRLAESAWTDFWNQETDELSSFESREEWEQNKWFDTKINKKDNKPEGMRRYAKNAEKIWRGNNPRPAKPKLDTDLINLGSQKQMPLALSSLGIKLPNFRSATLSQALLTTTPEQQQLLRSLLEYKKVSKLLSAFGDRMIALVGSDGRVRGNFNQIGTATGRPTCTDPNMLQMPKEETFRSCFTASSGNVFIVADYSQMELRIMAQLSKDKAMMEAFHKGVDLHSYTASLMFNKPIDECGKDSKERKIAKTINFGVLYGMGPGKLRETLATEGVTMEFPEAKASIARWKATFKNAAKMIEQLGIEAATLGYTSTPFGRKRFFNTDFRDADGNPDNGQKFAVMREGANHPIQGTNADITKLAMHMIEEKVKPIGGGVRLNIYDETVTEVPAAYGPWALQVVETCMRVAAQAVLTDVPAQVDPMISRSWSKLDAIAA